MSNSTAILDYYHLLELEPEWDLEKLREELKKSLAKFQARVNAVTGPKREQIELRIAWIRSARKVFNDLESKAKYDLELAEYKRTAPPEEQAAAAGILTISEIWALINDGRYVDAIEAGKSLVSYEPKNDRAWEVYGFANYQWKDFNTAIYAAEQAIQCNPRNAEYYSDAGIYLASANRWDDSVLQLNRAIQLEPTNISYKLTLSNIHIQHESWEDAEAILKGVLSQEPSNQVPKSLMAIVIHDRAIGRIPQVNALAVQEKKKEARKLLKEIKSDIEKAQKLVENDSDMRELFASNSISIRRDLGVNSYQRIFGLLLDTLLALPGILLLYSNNTSSIYNNILTTIGGCIYLVVVLGYSWIYLAAKNNGQDLVKRILGMQIINDKVDSYPNINKLVFRAILKPVTLGLTFITVLLVFVVSYIPSLSRDSFVEQIFAILFSLVGIFVLLWSFLFITDKDLAPSKIGFILFLHDKLTKTTVASSNRDGFMNFGSYKWYGNSKEKIILLVVAGLTAVIVAFSGVLLFQGGGQQFSQGMNNSSSTSTEVDSSQKEPSDISSSPNSSRQQPDISPSITPSNSPTSLTKEDAVSLVKRWLSARSQMFAPPYNQELGTELATGKAYSDKVHGPSSDGTDTSTLEWLRKYDYYYTYNSTNIGEIISFRQSENEVILDLVVIDDKTQYDNKRKVVSKNSGKTKNVMRYRLRYESDKWKISDIEDLQKIKD